MKIAFAHNGAKKRLKLSEGTTIVQVVKRFGLNDETFITKLNDSVAHPATKLKQGDKLESTRDIRLTNDSHR